MALSDARREQRRNYLGASDAAAVLGLSPWATPADVYYSKVQALDSPETDATKMGHVLEKALLAFARQHLGFRIRSNVFRVNSDGICSATHDALAQDRPEGIEAKTSGLFWHGAVSDEWGDAGTNQIPRYYYLQCQHQMYVSDLQVVHVPALLGGKGLIMYRVDRRDDVIAKIVPRLHDFWNNHVRKRIPPEHVAPSLDILKAIRREPESVTQIDGGLVEAFEAAREARLNAEKKEKSAQAALIAALGECEGGLFHGGMVTYLEQTRHNKPREASVSTFRTLRIKHIEPEELTDGEGSEHAGEAAADAGGAVSQQGGAA